MGNIESMGGMPGGAGVRDISQLPSEEELADAFGASPPREENKSVGREAGVGLERPRRASVSGEKCTTRVDGTPSVVRTCLLLSFLCQRTGCPCVFHAPCRCADLFDKNGRGTVATKEMIVLLRSFNFYPTEVEERPA
jgi:hypothetical protein